MMLRAATLFLALSVQPCAGIRHSQAYLARKAAKAAAAAAARNHTRTQPLVYPRTLAQHRQAAAPAANVPEQTLHAAQIAPRLAKAARHGSQSATSGYPSNLVSVFKAMRREEEEAADGSAPELPPDIVTCNKICTTRYGTMVYRTIQKQGPPPAVAPLDVIFLHGMGTDGSNCQPPAEALSVAPSGQSSSTGEAGRRWIIPDLMGHGASNVSHDPYAYKMDAQAAGVLAVMLVGSNKQNTCR